MYRSCAADCRSNAAVILQNKTPGGIYIVAIACQYPADGYFLSNRLQCCCPYLYYDGWNYIFFGHRIQPPEGVFLCDNQSLTRAAFSQVCEINYSSFYYLYS